MTSIRNLFKTTGLPVRAPIVPRDVPSVGAPAAPPLDLPPMMPRLSIARRSAPRSELVRILHLPRADYSKLPDLTPHLLLSPSANTWPDGEPIELRPVQNKMLHACREAGGGLFFVSTGHGKSFAAILAASVMPDVDRAIIFTPASTVANLRAEYFRLRLRFKVLPMPALTIRSTEELSRARTEDDGDLLDELIMEHGGNPARTVIIFDEAHRLKNLKSARGARVMRAILKHPEVRVVAMSGSMTTKSLHDAAHIAWYALRDGSPFPVQYGGAQGDHAGHRLLEMEALSACIDEDGKPTPEDWQRVSPLLTKYYPELLLTGYMTVPGPERTSMLRRAFSKLMSTTPGVVLTKESSIQNVELHLEGVRPDVPPEVQQKMHMLAMGRDPNDMPIPDDVTLWRLQKQVAQGFYYVWDWPKDHTGKPVVDLKWRGARSQWNKTVRDEISNHARTGYDSEMLVYNSVKNTILRSCVSEEEREFVHWVSRTTRDGLAWENLRAPSRGDDIWRALRDRNRRNDAAVAWLDWSAIEKHKPEPPVKGVWISDYLLDHALEWARKQPLPPILWYEHREVGARLAQKGVAVYGQGTEPPTKETLCALSIGVHSEGKNLQAWSNQLVICPPTSNTRWEQMLGRTYRSGQKKDIVRCYIYQHDPSFEDAINKARAAAAYVQDTSDTAQKLLFAEYSNIKLRKVTYRATDDDDSEDTDI